jgi:hypothetical protein
MLQDILSFSQKEVVSMYDTMYYRLYNKYSDIEDFIKTQTIIHGYLLADSVFAHNINAIDNVRSDTCIKIDKDLYEKHIDCYFLNRTETEITELGKLTKFTSSPKKFEVHLTQHIFDCFFDITLHEQNDGIVYMKKRD